MRWTLHFVLAGIALVAQSHAALAGEPVRYTGKGTYVVSRALLPLANGGAAVQLVNRTVATIEPSESGFMSGDCAGLGYLTPEGESSLDAMCSFELSAADAFVISVTGDPKMGARVQVLGGRGRFENASGTGKIRQTFLEDDRGSYEYEFSITTP